MLLNTLEYYLVLLQVDRARAVQGRVHRHSGQHGRIETSDQVRFAGACSCIFQLFALTIRMWCFVWLLASATSLW